MKSLGAPKGLYAGLGRPKSMVTRNAEEYLEALYKLTLDKKVASTTEISKTLKIAPASVTEMLKKLDDKSYVNYSPYAGTSLTNKGLKIAEKITRKHRLLERFLHDILKLGKDMVHKQACEMEHSLSDQAEEALCRFLKYPDRCPDDGKTIPPCDLNLSSCKECLEIHGKGLEEIGRRARESSLHMRPQGTRPRQSIIRKRRPQSPSKTVRHGPDTRHQTKRRQGCTP